LIEQRKFRDDLFFRINVFPIHLPPLRERSEDIPLMVQAFIRRLRSKTGKEISGLTPEAMECFMNYDWPGNVRELKSALEFAFVIAESGLIDLEQLPPKITNRNPTPVAPQNPAPQGAMPHDNEMILSSPVARPRNIAEKEALVNALRQANGNQSQAARILGINRVTVWNRMRKYGIDLKRVLTTQT
jgi:DNA-binding NtrC family response regulator